MSTSTNRRTFIKTGLAAGLAGSILAPPSTMAASHPADPAVMAPAPEGIPIAPEWTVFANGQKVPVYSTTVFIGGPAFFCNIHVNGPVAISATPAWPVRDAVVRPLSKAIKPTLDDRSIQFRIDTPCQLSVETNHLTTHPLFIFANPVEENVPKQEDPNVIYYGPGLHVVDVHTVLTSGKTLYLADGAWLRAVMPEREKEKPVKEKDAKGPASYNALFHAEKATRLQIRGRGVVDMSHLDWGTRCALCFSECSNVQIEGITILDCPRWTVVIAGCKEVKIENVKLIGHRESNDGMDLVNSSEVTVSNCFARVGDDGFVIKTFPGGQPSHAIRVEKCVVWNDKVRGLGICAEAGEPIHHIHFRDCDIIHDLTTDFDMAWSMAIYTEDRGPISDVCFEDIRCEDTKTKLIQVCVKEGKWSTTGQLGPIKNVVFKNIRYLGKNRPMSAIQGNDAVHSVQSVRIENLIMNEMPVGSAEEGNFHLNEFATDIQFSNATP